MHKLSKDAKWIDFPFVKHNNDEQAKKKKIRNKKTNEMINSNCRLSHSRRIVAYAEHSIFHLHSFRFPFFGYSESHEGIFRYRFIVIFLFHAINSRRFGMKINRQQEQNKSFHILNIWFSGTWWVVHSEFRSMW